MNEWLMTTLTKLIRKRYALFRNLIVALLVLSLTACGGKAVSQDVSQLAEKPVQEQNAQLSNQISEVAPPEVIQELRQSLEIYQPQVQILNPQPGEVLQEDRLKVRFQVKDLPIFKSSQYELGSHLEVILDNQPGLKVYDLNQPLEFSNLSPGTHTLRVFASRPWDESFKNEGAYAQTTFHVFTKSDDNNPDIQLPILTYNSPEGSYGAEPVLLDFYLTNAPLHILAQDNPDNPISDWRIRCTINGESFIIDRWQSIYLKGFKAGKNWVKLEFIDNQGNPVKNVYNSTVKVINYESNGQDALAKIVRGEVSAEDLRGIVDADYAVEIPTEESPEIQIEEKVGKGGFFNRFKRGKEDTKSVPQPEDNLEEAIPEVIETPQPEDTLEETIPEVIETPQSETVETGNNSEEVIPEVIESPQSESTLEETIPEAIETPQPETLETGNNSEEEIQPVPKSAKSKLDGLLNRFKRGKEDKTSIPQPEIEKTPETIETSIPDIKSESQINEVEPKVEVESTSELPPTLPEIVEPVENQPPVIQEEIPQPSVGVTPEPKQSTTKKLRDYFNLPRRTTPVPTPEVSPEVIKTPQSEINLEKATPEVDEIAIKTEPEQQETTVPEKYSRIEVVP